VQDSNDDDNDEKKKAAMATMMTLSVGVPLLPDLVFSSRSGE